MAGESWSFNPATSFCFREQCMFREEDQVKVRPTPQDSSSVHVKADPQPTLKAFLRLTTDDKQSLVEENVQGK